MPNNPNFPPERLAALAEAGKKTQIGQPGSGTTPGRHGGNQPYSLQHSVRYLMGQRINKNESLEKYLPEDPTPAQLMAANTIALGIKGNMRAVEWCADRVDGKVLQPNLNADLAHLQSMSDDDLKAEYDRLQRVLTSMQDHGRDDQAQGADEPAPDASDELPGADPSPGV